MRQSQEQDLQNIQTESGFLLGGDTWNNAVFTLSIILYSDTAVATVVNREYWEKQVLIIWIYRNKAPEGVRVKAYVYMHLNLGNVWSVYHQKILCYYEHLLAAKKLYKL